MNTKQLKKQLILNIPYIILGLLATNLGEAWRKMCIRDRIGDGYGAFLMPKSGDDLNNKIRRKLHGV